MILRTILVAAIFAASSKLQAADPVTTSSAKSATVQKVIVGGGCFWCVEAVFQRVNGVKKVVSGYTPVAAVEYLKQNPPRGMVFSIYEWGDFLQWNGPPGMKVFVNSHAHLVPREIWQAYMQIIEQRSGWEDGLDRYGVNTIVLDRDHREPLVKRLKEDEKWKIGFEQDGQLVFLRKKPI